MTLFRFAIIPTRFTIIFAYLYNNVQTVEGGEIELQEAGPRFELRRKF